MTKTANTQACNQLPRRTKKRHQGIIKSLIVFAFIGYSLPSFAGSDKLIENPATPLSDTWIVTYDADDFTDEVKKARILYIPKQFGPQAAFTMQCKPFFTNFSMEYIDQQKNLASNGKLANASSSFAKHGYIYDDKQKMTVNVAGNSETYRPSVGGQTNHTTGLFKTKNALQTGEMGMTWFYSFTFKEMPSFRPSSTPEEAQDFFKQLNNAIKQQQSIDFTLEADNNHVRNFTLDTKRMTNFVPEEVMDFCITKRQLK